MRSLGSLALAVLAGCSVLVDSELAGKARDAGRDAPTGPFCDNTVQCLAMVGREFDCRQQCIGNACVTPTPEGAPDGIPCGTGPMGTQICVGSSCVRRACGDGFVDRMGLMMPEYCDDGNDVATDACNNDCTRSCVPPAPANCNDMNPCNGEEMCDSAAGSCRAMRNADDGTPCTATTGASGTCQRGRCMVE